MEKLLVSVPEAGRILGVGRTSIYSLINDGKLDSRLIGRRRLVTTASIANLVTDQS